MGSCKFRSALAIRINQFPRAICYPYGLEYFESLQPLTKSQRADYLSYSHIAEELKLQRDMDKEDKRDMIFMWSSLAILCILYAVTDLLLLSWLG